MSLKSKFDKIANKYLKKFMEKHGFENPDMWWVAGMVGTTLFVNDYFLNFEDIRYDLDNEIEKEMLFEWYYYNLEKQEYNINYKSYLSGGR